MRGKQFLMHGGLPVEEWFIGQAKVFREAEAKKIVKEAFHHAPTIQDIVTPYYNQVKGQDDLTKKQFLDMNLWLVGDILLKADKMSMAHSLEVRVPFLDKQVMAIASKIPASYRINETETKHAMRLAARKALPEASAARKKIGFPVPIRNWIREERFYRQIKTYFTSAEAEEFFSIEDIMQLLNDHYEGKANNGRKIWTIFTFLIWHKRYFQLDSEPVAAEKPVSVGAAS
ncbi:asparagine synthase C-terminal domain-containing protein [Planococcus sp. 107-1]|uniref:asparagine synthase C-terminal domain-containing protein n=1 Tax=Planococcus sp. 107-1 TaxID=2908840 RepID=UPI00288331FD|nr:asparagine synthase C-terminal domain-containing protein [Planococcus sp. 107-1]